MTYRLTDASVTIRPSDVVLRYTVAGEQPERDHWSLTTAFVSADGQSIRRLGFKILDGRWIASYAFDHATATQSNYSASPSLTGDVWTLVLPLEALGTAAGGKWHADLDVAGVDAGTVKGSVVD
jgi:hypothetical protein